MYQLSRDSELDCPTIYPTDGSGCSLVIMSIFTESILEDGRIRQEDNE